MKRYLSGLVALALLATANLAITSHAHAQGISQKVAVCNPSFQNRCAQPDANGAIPVTTSGGASSMKVQGPDAIGANGTANPVRIGGSASNVTGGPINSWNVDANGIGLVQGSGVNGSTAGTRGMLVGGSDGTNYRHLYTNAAGGTGVQATVSGSPTVSTTAYATGDVVGSLITLSNAVRASGSGLVQKVVLNFKSSQTTPFDVLIFNANPTGTTFTDNAALAVAAADFDKIAGVVHVTDCTNLGTPSACQATGLALPVTASATTLYAVVVARGAPTLASTSDMTVRVGIIQD